MSGLADDEQHEPSEEEQAMISSLEEMMESIRRAKVGELILSTVSTLASVAYGKLEARDLPETKLAIDAIGVLLPMLEGQVDEGILREFGQALTSLKLAYADAVAQAE